MPPTLTLHPLHRADGSATHTTPLFTILAAANGPLEVSRRDELPEEAAIEVNVRPCSGVGGPRERWMEGVITSLLKSLVLVNMYPRTLVQVTLQVTKEPGMGGLKRAVKDVALLAGLGNAAFAALVDAGVALGGTMVVGLGVAREGEVVVEPGEKELLGCGSVHAVAWGMRGEMLMAESAGRFGVEEWEGVAGRLRGDAMGAIKNDEEDGDDVMDGEVGQKEPWLRQALGESVRDAGAWRETG
ncbi:exosome non-catalytic core subunit rrp46 [Saxophila tyrrhenica]|uniref:Exosome non-catalytic core subunit rrp46 n=1 Tax=Saxophila tyrrhenica TaxID=1690608 RepID=A0AAV9PBR1_9PEZI|nr:exosome non-catalytic core subunit rrp46 [Saxophila tyrrhenica]